MIAPRSDHHTISSTSPHAAAGSDLPAAQYLRVAFERSPEAIVVANAVGQIIDANPAALVLLGYARDELLRLGSDDLVPPSPIWTEEAYAQFIRDGWWEGEVEVQTKGGPCPVQLRTVILPGGDGGLWVSFFHDLDERRQSEATRARLAALVASSADAIVGETLDGIITDWNPAAERLYGYTAEEVIGQPFTMLIPPDRRGETADIVERLLRGQSIETFETERWTKDGRRVDVSVTISPVWNDARQIIGVSAIVRDITQRKEAEAELAATHQRTREVLERITDGFLALDREWRFTYLNEAAERLMQRSREELLGRNIWEVYPLLAGSPIFDTYHRAIREGTTVTTEIKSPTDDIWYGIHAYPSPDGLSVFFRDVTERKRFERETQAALAGERAANRAKNLFLAMMSHELRTPLQAVLGYSDFLLAEQGGPLTPEQREDVGAIRQGADRMADLIERMLDLSRIEAGALELISEPVDLAQILEQVRQDVAPQVAAKGLALRVVRPRGLPLVLGDPMRIRQVLLNLASNAVKFTERGSVRLSARATAEGVDVIVSDTGIGIAPEALPYIFEEFRQADNGSMRRFEGAGLGLAIARRLAEQMGGSISVTSQPGKGSTFTLHLDQ